MDKNLCVGNGLELPWKGDDSVKWDMSHFKETTELHTVIMGKNTFLSMGKNGLPKRVNFVVSKSDLSTSEKNICDLRDKTIQEAYMAICQTSLIDKQPYYIVPSTKFVLDILTQMRNLQVNYWVNKETAFLIGGPTLIESEIDKVTHVCLTQFNKGYTGDKYFNKNLLETFIEYDNDHYDNGDIKHYILRKMFYTKFQKI